jgi:hypothetical protein
MNQLVNKFLEDVKRDKKRAALLGVLVLVAGIVIARQFLSQTPQPASAASVSQAYQPRPAVQADATGAPKVAKPFVRVDKKISRDIFAPNTDYFPVEAAPVPQKIVTSAPTTQEATSVETMVRNLAQSLQLQSTMLGDQPTAIINGRVLKAGDSLKQFKVVSISTDQVVLERNGIEVTLEMKK